MKNWVCTFAEGVALMGLTDGHGIADGDPKIQKEPGWQSWAPLPSGPRPKSPLPTAHRQALHHTPRATSASKFPVHTESPLSSKKPTSPASPRRKAATLESLIQPIRAGNNAVNITKEVLQFPPLASWVLAPWICNVQWPASTLRGWNAAEQESKRTSLSPCISWVEDTWWALCNHEAGEHPNRSLLTQFPSWSVKQSTPYEWGHCC